MTSPAPPRLRRSVLYVPGSNARAIEKARTLPADVVILDLEDAVLPEAKAAARAAVAAAATTRGFLAGEIVIRINGIDTPWGRADLAAAGASGADAILLPKVHAPADVTAAEAVLITGGFSQQLWIMAETPSAILQLAAITAASPRVAAIVMGTADLAAALRMPGGSGSPALGTANALALLAARARGVDIIAGIHPDLADHDGLAAACRAERAAGFDGKTLIHPAQIEVANDAFGVSDADAAAAAALVAAWERAAAGGSGIAVVDGRMVEKLHADDARRLLALHAAARRA